MKSLLILILFLVPLSLVFLFNEKKYQEPVYCKYADEISFTFLKDMNEKYGLICHGTGGGFLDNVEQIFLALHSSELKLNIDKSRVLYINCSENLLKRVNEDEKIRPYLDHYSFTHKGIHLTFSFFEKDRNKIRRRVQNNYIAYISNINGNIYYSYFDSQENDLKTLYKEPYEEALKIVKEQGLLES